MNVYKNLNEITKYIDDNLDGEIDFEILASKMGVNVYTLERLFSLLTSFTLTEYIRKRKLSSAGLELYNEECFVMDVAIKYGYDSATAFSRAFQKFHGIKPSKITDISELKIFPRLVFQEEVNITNSIDFKVVTIEEKKLYGIGIKTNNENISSDAPNFFSETENKYLNICGPIKYAIVLYSDKEREHCTEYYVLYEKYIEGFMEFTIPSGKYLAFRIDSQEAVDIQKLSKQFYFEFLPSCKYNLRNTPEIEYYHDGVLDFYVPIC